MAEHEINLSGAVNPDQAIQVGQLTGAKVIVTGSVVQVESNLYLVAKIIGTETTRVLGASITPGRRSRFKKARMTISKADTLHCPDPSSTECDSEIC